MRIPPRPSPDWSFNPPPGWPIPPPGWTPTETWSGPEPHWPAAPPYWSWWIRQQPWSVPPASGQARSSAMWAHLGALLMDVAGLVTCGVTSLLIWIPPLVILNGAAGADPFVRHQARQSLNFAFTELIASFALLFLVLVTGGLAIVLALAMWVVFIVFRIMAATAANRGEPYRYPLAIPFLA
ncbi:DUF4870 domain-containing protein [Nonomuraea sp. NN258]|uniref:DUF4870 domain-containing protein n=1 Tax=Nonomuraea antri TaxID=2730852 RepID=UPI001567DB2D|nr:DUF4870 domain-containing protein [Nonomuraea antri]NRQ32623.1 DUF4870 domain-containing protein [Nonomuraea antri]